MYYYGNNGYSSGGYQMPCSNNGFVGYTQGFGTSGAIWIVLFILLVIIIGSGWSFFNNNNNN